MPRRSSPNQIETLDDLSGLKDLVVDKRLGQRAHAKKNRRNRHYEKQFLKTAVTHQLLGTAEEDDIPLP